MKRSLLFASLFSMVLVCPLSATTLEKTRVLTLPLQGIKALSVDAGAGFLKVSGNEKATEIHVKADIRIKEPTQKDCEKILQNNLRLSLVRRGNKAILTANFEEINHIFTFFSSDTVAAIDLTVTLPKKMDLYVDDGSGYTQIDSLDGSITVDDGSGDLVIRETSGWLSIDDGSGNLTVEDHKGDAKIDDGSGELVVRGNWGNLAIDDGSGNLEVLDTRGNITVEDGSGEIVIRNVTGNVIISDGAGNITVEDVEKDFIVKEDGSGSIKSVRVKGKVVEP